MRRIHLLLCAAALLAGTSVWADKLPVNMFRYAGPFNLLQPYQIDSVNVKQKAFEPGRLLDTPLSFAAVRQGGETCSQLPATSTAGGSYALHLASFMLENRCFAEVKLQVEGVKHYRLFVDGERQEGGMLKLNPASHEVILKYLAMPDVQEMPSVSIETERKELITLRSEGQRMFTLADVLYGTRFGGTSLSPDGRYLMTTFNLRREGGKSDRITGIKELATGRVVAERSEHLQWMPRSMAYYYTRSGVEGRQLIKVDVATGMESLLADNLPEGRFMMAPTEDYLLFTLTDEGPKENKEVYEVVHPDDRQPGWRSRSRLAKYDLQTGLMQPLTFGFRNAWCNDISQDGRYLLMTVRSSRLTGRPTKLSSLYRLNVQTLQAELLVENDGFIGGACFSPDGERILISGSPESLGGIGKKVKEGQTPSMTDGQLFLMTLADRKVQPLTRDFNPSVSHAEWSTADGQIYFMAEDRDCVHLFRLDSKNLRIQRLDLPEELVKQFSLASASPAMAYYGESACNAERLYTVNLKNLKTTLVRDLFQEQMNDVALGDCQAWDFVNSRGDTICGRFYLPPHFDPKEQYPLIVNYYGGCSPVSRTFESRYPHHAYAALGYVVYVIEPSGCTGFGQEFSARHVNTAGDYVADDIIEGTRRFAAEHVFVNSKKIGCIGASYGGFMTQYLQTKTDLFAAAISHAGISDHTSYWGEGYWGYSYSEVSMAHSYPWKETELYVEHSPLYNADKIHTPLLFLHGDVDHNVPVGESIQMYTALKLLGRETAMVLVNGQDHHILDYSKRIRWQNTIFAWFAKWLQDDPTWWNSLYAPKAL